MNNQEFTLKGTLKTGTSQKGNEYVYLDLQFDKGKRQRISIKSRYNHTVDHPDATYSNNLEAIALGLTRAFEQDYGFNIGEQNIIGFELNDYVEARDGKFYKYN